MTTAVDSNVLSALLGSEAGANLVSVHLGHWHRAGEVMISGIAYAELTAHPGASLDALGRFLAEVGIEVDFELGAAVWKLAGSVYATYAERRRRAGGGEARRMIADFVIGAHAQLRADRMATLDRGRYAAAFPRLRLVS